MPPCYRCCRRSWSGCRPRCWLPEGSGTVVPWPRSWPPGASGARMGTRFLATPESGAHPQYKQAVVAAGLASTEITDVFAVCPLCATEPRVRVLRPCIDAMLGLGDESAGEATVAGRPFPIVRGSGMPPGASAQGRIDAMAMYAGESAAAISSLVPTAELIEELVTTAVRQLRAAPLGDR
ncbi:MAG TPA: nitronate monooxygenase [Acidimicrobiales bacterium]|nr:nitronate monooxygenase [Acidimicrobiales bacterium]